MTSNIEKEVGKDFVEGFNLNRIIIFSFQIHLTLNANFQELERKQCVTET